MSLNRKTLRRLILEEIERISEMEEFSGSKSGKAFMKEGSRICSSAKKIYEISKSVNYYQKPLEVCILKCQYLWTK